MTKHEKLLLGAAFLVVLAFATLAVFGCGSGNNGPVIVASTGLPPPGPPDAGSWNVVLDRRFWHQHYNSRVVPDDFFLVAPPLKTLPDGLGEIFPPASANIRFNYLVYPQKGVDISRFSTITLTIRVEDVTGAPVFIWQSPTNNCKVGCIPASAHLMLWGPPGDLFSTHDRWWADAFITMAPGTATITVSMDKSHWFGVNGQSGDDPGFDATLKHLVALCVTLGGGFFSGHGLYTTGGTSEFDLLEYRLD